MELKIIEVDDLGVESSRFTALLTLKVERSFGFAPCFCERDAALESFCTRSVDESPFGAQGRPRDSLGTGFRRPRNPDASKLFI